MYRKLLKIFIGIDILIIMYLLFIFLWFLLFVEVEMFQGPLVVLNFIALIFNVIFVKWKLNILKSKETKYKQLLVNVIFSTLPMLLIMILLIILYFIRK